jgi:hypothetical protein
MLMETVPLLSKSWYVLYIYAVVLTDFDSLELLGENIEDGLLGWVTMGVSASASYSITSTNYLNSTGA